MDYEMPPVGVEPTLPKKLDFESSASANSATEAWVPLRKTTGEDEEVL